MAQRDKDKPLYMISVAAELTGLHPQTLRIYEAKGLVTPQRSSGNTRLYSQNDIERLELISKLTDEGINLAGVVRILDMRERMQGREAEIEALRDRVAELEEQMHEYKVRATVAALLPSQTNSTPPEHLLDAGQRHGSHASLALTASPTLEPQISLSSHNALHDAAHELTTQQEIGEDALPVTPSEQAVGTVDAMQALLGRK